MINWLEEVEKRKDDLIRDTQDFLKIKSIPEEEGTAEGAPYGKGIKDALDFALHKCEEFGMPVKNVDGWAGHAEIGQGEELIGVLCHVDVVPEGDGWNTPPYSADIRDGKMFARGAIDDKGPTMAAIYAMKIIKDLDLELNRRIRVIFGTDEETHGPGLNYYFEREEMPNMGFAPDADFPIIIAEKGITNVTLQGNVDKTNEDNNKAKINSFQAGKRPNMVPDHAIVKIKGKNELFEQIITQFKNFLEGFEHNGEYKIDDDQLIISIQGVSAHGMEPHKGVNAGLELLHFLTSVEPLLEIDNWIKWSDQHLYQDYYGNNLGIQYEDDITGPLTVNSGFFKLEEEKITIKLNIRYPVTTAYDDMIKNIENQVTNGNLTILNIENSQPHHVDKKHFLIKTLQHVYEEQTGQEATLLSIGGGTYAREMKNGVAFGPLFPGKVETAHQKDEHIEIEDLLKATAIYAQAIYELAK